VRPLCLVYGNCQAEPIRALLASSPEFANRYEALPMPAVHEIPPSRLPALQTIIRASSLIIAQPIKDDYRGLPIGTNQIAALAPRDCIVLRFQAMHYDALYPFQFNVLGDDRLGISAPLTAYHDLRTLSAAARGFSTNSAMHWLSHLRPSQHALRTVADHAGALIRTRDSTTDIRLFDSIVARPGAGPPSFFTVNHPSRLVLQRIADSIHEILGLTAATNEVDGRQPLGQYRTPIEQCVIDALGLSLEPTHDWVIDGRRVSTAHIVRRHLAWYRRRPDVVRAALDAHADRIATFGLV